MVIGAATTKVQRASKILAAVLLIASTMLPVAVRSYYADAQGKPVALYDTGDLPNGAYRVVERDYIVQVDRPIVVWVFTWPIIALTALWRKQRGKLAVAVRVFELPLLAYTGLVIWATPMLANIPWAGIPVLPTSPAVGAYLGSTALVIYGASAIWSDVSLTRRWWSKRTERQSARGAPA